MNEVTEKEIPTQKSRLITKEILKSHILLARNEHPPLSHIATANSTSSCTVLDISGFIV